MEALQYSPQWSWLLALAILILAVLLRRPLAEFLIRVVGWVLEEARFMISRDIDERLVPSAGIIVISIAVVLAVHILDLPVIWSAILIRVAETVVVLAIYAGVTSLVECFVDVDQAEESKEGLSEITWVKNVLKLLTGLVALAAALAVWDIQISTALASASVLGAALALAMQDLLRNIVAGWALKASPHIHKGDWVTVPRGSGGVEEFGARSTLLRQFDKSLLVVPNQELINETIVNGSRRPRWMLEWSIALPLETKVATLEAFCDGLGSALMNNPYTDKDGTYQPRVHLIGFGESSTNIRIEAYTSEEAANFRGLLDCKDAVTKDILRIAEENGTHLAKPNIDVTTHPSPSTSPQWE